MKKIFLNTQLLLIFTVHRHKRAVDGRGETESPVAVQRTNSLSDSHGAVLLQAGLPQLRLLSGILLSWITIIIWE